MTIANLVRERITTTGQVTADLVLGGVVDQGYKRFADAFPSGATGIHVTVFQDSGASIGIADYDEVADQIDLTITESVIAGVPAGTTALTLDGTAQVSISPNKALFDSKADLTEWGAINRLISAPGVVAWQIYDTRFDTDLGLWRGQTRSTSWYNEPLNTVTRGKTRDFPERALIIAQGDTVTIYDLTDPDVPMWMVFNGSTFNMITTVTASEDVRAIVMKNGKMFYGTGATGIGWIDFVSDNSERRNSSGTRIYKGSIAERNAGLGDNTNTSNPIVNSAVNSIAVIILSDAPLDEFARPIPTIAVATDGGVSVIKHDGTVVDLMTSSGVIKKVAFDEKGRVWMAGGAGVAFFAWRFDTIPATDSNAYSYVLDQTSIPARKGAIGNSTIGSNALSVAGNIVYLDERAGISTNDKLIILDVDNKTIKEVTSTYATPEMSANTIACLMADTETGDIGGDKVVNGGFDADSNWTKGAGWTISGGVATATAATGDLDQIPLPADFAGDDEVTVTYTISNYTAGAVRLLIYSGDANKVGITTSRSSNGTFTEIVKLDQTGSAQNLIRVQSITDPLSCDIDNLSISEAIPDRSAADNPAQVFGIIPRNTVETGAEKVAYTFGPGRAALVPHSAGMEIGTDDFLFAYLHKSSGSAAASRTIVCLGDTALSGSSVHITFDPAGGGLTRVRLSDDGFVTVDDALTTGGTENDNAFHAYVFRRNGANIEAWKDGVLQNTTAISNAAASLTNVNSVLAIGKRTNDTQELTTTDHLLDFQFSGGSVSEDYIKNLSFKMLMSLRGNVTLGGTSDQVNAVAYDFINDLVYVPTDDGCSIFDLNTRLRVAHLDSSNTTLTSDVIDFVSALDGAYAVGNKTTGEVYYYEPPINIRQRGLL